LCGSGPPEVRGGEGPPESVPAVFRRPAPGTLDELKSMERHLRSLSGRVAPAVVAVTLGETSGSGVVITEEGLVLTAAHVVGAPGRDVRFTFPDGKTARGKTLGANDELDAGMMKITDRGPWPFVAMSAAGQARVGDWVLAMGHPGGFEPGRAVVVRLGRIIGLDADAVQTDCTISGGDSGGPLFDMRGGVVGVHSRISEGATENFHVPVRAYRQDWERLTKGEQWGGQTRPTRPWFGARGVDHADGCQLEFVEEDSPAAKAGLQVGDIVRRIMDEAVDGAAALRRLIGGAKPGDTLRVEIRRAERTMVINVTLEARGGPR